jgi:hypothetical protein
MATFTSTDAKLKRLLYWYHQHSDEISLSIAQVSAIASAHNHISSLKYSEKQERIKALRAAEKIWKEKQGVESNGKKQQPITKFFNIKPKASNTTEEK